MRPADDRAEDGPPALTGAGGARLRSGDARIVLVGASGWLGLATLDLLHRTLGPAAFARRVVCFGSRPAGVRLRGGVGVGQQPLGRIAELPARPTLLLNLAFLTKDKVGGMSDAAYAAANRALSAQLLAALDAIGTEAIFIPSSGAAYRADDATADPALQRYGALKCEQEAVFAGWAAAGGRRAVIARLFNLSGPYINKRDHYALAGFIGDALAGRPIAVRATRRVERGFVAIRELMALVFALLTDGTVGTTRFDSGGAALEMGEIAGEVAAVLGSGQGVVRAAPSAQDPDIYVGDRTVYDALRQAAGVEPVDFATQVRETAAFLAAGAAWYAATPDGTPDMGAG